MANPDETSSTERLLELIRNEEKTGDTLSESLAAASPGKHKKKAQKRWLSSGKSTVVGIDRDKNALMLVMVKRLSDRRVKLLACKSVPFDPQLPEGGAEFDHFIKTSLADFCRFSKRRALWAVLPFGQGEIRPIRIPRVPKKQVANAVYWTIKKESAFDAKGPRCPTLRYVSARMRRFQLFLGRSWDGRATNAEVAVRP